MRTLVLDNTYFPVKIVSWQKAMILLFTGRAEIVTEYQERSIQGVNQSYTLPKILRLFNRHKSEKKVRFCRQNVFYRDNFQCQYCGIKLPMGQLTIDHVHPQSRGGQNTWENVVACCPSCNVKKGNKTPREANFKLRKVPKRPKWSPHLCLRLKKDDPVEWSDWFPLATPSVA